mmetsp:Transcript_6763/g.16426  ORF Transcript_6763/g.16426 Transcript_6763/m.16426 type:complete len:252 (+) Transcript_6763:3-758(+)
MTRVTMKGVTRLGSGRRAMLGSGLVGPSRGQPFRWLLTAAAISSSAVDGAAGAAGGLVGAANALFAGVLFRPPGAGAATNPPSALAIRTALAKDVLDIKRINEAVLPENYPLGFYQQQLSDWPGLQLVACTPGESGTVVGYCLGKMEAAGRGHIISIAVLPEHRNCGCATAIMREVTLQMRQRYAAAEVTLNVRSSNTAALHVYTSKLGYRTAEVYARYYQNGEDAMHLVLPLAEKAQDAAAVAVAPAAAC